MMLYVDIDDFKKSLKLQKVDKMKVEYLSV